MMETVECQHVQMLGFVSLFSGLSEVFFIYEELLQACLANPSIQDIGDHFQLQFFTPQPLRTVRVLFSPMVSGWAGGPAGSGKKFAQAVSQKP